MQPRLWRLGAVALILAGLAACTRPAPPGPPLPLIVPSDTPLPTSTATPEATAKPTATARPRATASAAPATAQPSATAWPTVQTATPLFVAEVPTLGADTVATLPPPLATQPPVAGPAAPIIASFTIEPAQIMPGQPVTLTWQATAERVTLQRIDLFGRLGEFFDVGPSGTMVLGPPPEQRGEVQFALFAATGSTTVQASARAAILCPDTWFFSNPPPECPATPPQSTPIQAQPFERGLLLWVQNSDSIYALYADGGYPRWDSWANAWFPGQPETDPNLVPPPGYYQPVRGFGLAWRTGYVSPSEVARDRLGWATAEEAPVPGGTFQCDSLPKYSRCYLTGPEGVVVLQPERSGWEIR